jgi:hypothetical protein
MTQSFINHTTGLPVWTVDESGNTTQAGTILSGDGITLTKTPAPSNPSGGALKLYSPDGEAVQLLDATGTVSILSAGAGSGGIDWLNVKAYGAKGDNSTDDTTAVQAALTAANAQSGGVVYFPTGKYKISSALNVGAFTTLLGDGQDNSIITQTSTTANGLTCLDSVAVNIRELLVQGPSSGSGIGIAFTLSARSSCYQLEVSNCLVRNFGGDGINMATPIVSRLVRVVSQGNGGAGFHLTGGGTAVVMDACYGNSNTGSNYNLNQMNYSALNACASDSAGAIGYLLTTCNNVVLSGCGCEVPTSFGYEINGGVCNSLISCYVRTNPSIGAWFTGSSLSGFIQGFREITPSGATASIQVDAGCRIVSGENSVVTAVNFVQGTTAQFDGQTFQVPGNGSTGLMAVNRGATSNFASLALQTAGTTEWNIQLRSDSTNDLHVRDGANGVDSIIVEQHAAASNVQIGGAKSFGASSIGVVGITNAATLPTGNPTGGGVLYVNAGALTYRGSSGTVTILGPA